MRRIIRRWMIIGNTCGDHDPVCSQILFHTSVERSDQIISLLVVMLRKCDDKLISAYAEHRAVLEALAHQRAGLPDICISSLMPHRII